MRSSIYVDATVHPFRLVNAKRPMKQFSVASLQNRYANVSNIMTNEIRDVGGVEFVRRICGHKAVTKLIKTTYLITAHLY